MTSNQRNLKDLTSVVNNTGRVARIDGYLKSCPGVMLAIVLITAVIAGVILLANSQGAIVLYQAF